LSKAISPEEYRLFSDFLEDACGIVLGENKHYLVTSRLQRLMDELNIPSLSELVKRMGSVGGKSLQVRIIDAMTTNADSLVSRWSSVRYPAQRYFS